MSQPAATARTPLPLKLRLFVMMFLEYFVQGCYRPIISVYLLELGLSKTEVGIVGSALAVGPLAAPFLLGQLVDRYFPTQWVLAGCHILAAGLMVLLYAQSEFIPIVVVGTLYSIMYVPTLMLTNALTFHHLSDSEGEFPMIRVWGTIGFIAPAWLIEMYFLAGLTGAELTQARGIALLLSGIVEVVLAFYCLTLPSTPPQPQAAGWFAPAVVFGLLRRRDFLVLVLIGLVIAFCHVFYFVWNTPYLTWFLRRGGIEGALEQRISSIGQIAEVVVMATLGLMIARLGFRWTMALGAAAYAARALIFAAIPEFAGPYWLAMTLVCVGQALHGVCFGCFWAAGFIYVDRIAPKDIRGSMQTFFGTFVFGLGMVVGGAASGVIGEHYTTGEGTNAVSDWGMIWLISGIVAAASLVAFVLFFPSREQERL